ARPLGQHSSGHGEVPARRRQQQAQQVLLDVQLRRVELGLAHPCLGCGYAAPPWALGVSPAKARPKADKGGWVDQPRGRRVQRQARSAASRTASAKSQTSASAASGAPSGGGAAAIERLQAAVEQLEALQAEPPDGVGGCFTDVVASQLEAKRAELVRAQKANAISKGEKRLRAARQELVQEQAARDLVEAQLQKAQEELAELDAEVEEASRALQVLEEAAREEAEALRRQRAAEWAGASQVPGLLMQLGKLPEAWGSCNFEVAWAAIRAQMEAAVAPGSHSQPRSEAKPSSVAARAASGRRWPRHASGSWLQRQRAWLFWLLVLLAAPLGAASEVRSQDQRVPSKASAAGLRQHECGRAGAARLGGKRRRSLGGVLAPPAPGQATAPVEPCRWRWEAGSLPIALQEAACQRVQVVESALVGFHGIDVGDPPRYPGHAAGPSIVREPLSAEEGEVEALEFGASEWSDFMGQAGERCASPADAVVRTLERFGWYLESERCMVADLGDEFDPMFHGPRALSIEASSDARQASNRHEKRKLSSGPFLLRPLFGGAIGQLLGPGIELCVRGQRARGAYISNARWAMRAWRCRRPVSGRLDGKRYLGGSAKDSEGLPPAGERRQVQAATAVEPHLAGAALGVGAPAKRPRLESGRSTGGSAAALSATAAFFSILGHALSYACAGEGEGAQDIVTCSKRGACKVLGSHAGAKPRLKERCPGDKTNKSDRNQRSLWERGHHPGGRPRADKQRVKGGGIPALRSQGPVPGHAQVRYLEWLGIEAESAGGAPAAASSSGSSPAAPAAVQAAGDAAASLPLQRPASTRAGLLGVHGTTEEEYAAADSTAIDGQVSRRVRRRLG
ncbi:unnamed protein product, partial [Prorocentrum cordatum]